MTIEQFLDSAFPVPQKNTIAFLMHHLNPLQQGVVLEMLLLNREDDMDDPDEQKLSKDGYLMCASEIWKHLNGDCGIGEYQLRYKSNSKTLADQTA